MNRAFVIPGLAGPHFTPSTMKPLKRWWLLNSELSCDFSTGTLKQFHRPFGAPLLDPCLRFRPGAR